MRPFCHPGRGTRAVGVSVTIRGDTVHPCSAGWTFKDLEFLGKAYEIKGREQEEATAMMLGRGSYEAFPSGPGWRTSPSTSRC